MNHQPTPEMLAAKLIVRGIHLELTDALRLAATEKAARLLRHNSQIVRIRIDLELDRSKAVGEQFIAKGHIEIGGPDLIASATTEDAYKSLDQLMDKLDGLLRRRHGQRKDDRNHPHGVEVGGNLPKAE
jgi:putative sigma-54 modulation protein